MPAFPFVVERNQSMDERWSGNNHQPTRWDVVVDAIIRDGKLHQIKQVLPTGQSDGMITFERSAAVAHLTGQISLQDARRVVPDPQAFDQMLSLLRREAKSTVQAHRETTLTASRSLRSALGT